MSRVSTPSPLFDPDRALREALELAAAPHARVAPAQYGPGGRRLTRRGILWIGQTCNLRCFFCYFLNRIADKEHPEHPFMSLEKAKEICSTLVSAYGNTSIDINGGEPTIWGPVYDLVEHCASIGLRPSLITNALVLDARKVARLRDAGLRDLLVSVHGLGEVYDGMVGVEGAHRRQMTALRHCAEAGVPFRFNCVVTKEVAPQLPAVATLAARLGARAVNFIAFNPFGDQRNAGVRTESRVPRYREVAPLLDRALDVLAEAGVEANLRYFPFCVVAARHWPSVHDFQQLPYDTHEWDLASWAWTYQPAQRMRDGEPTPPSPLGRPLEIGRLRAPLVRLAQTRVGRPLRRSHDLWLRTGGPLLAKWLERPGGDRDALYRARARQLARQNGYRQGAVCSRCDLRTICDGFHGDYAAMLGTDEACPVDRGGLVDDPRHFVRRQRKLLEPEDLE